MDGRALERLKWRSRRGLLELDLVFERFWGGPGLEMDESQSAALEKLLALLNGELPDKDQKGKFDWTVTRHTMVHEQLARLYQGFRRDSHPMAVMVGVVGALSAFYHDSLDINNAEHREISAFRLIAKLPTIVAMSYKYNMGHTFMD